MRRARFLRGSWFPSAHPKYAWAIALLLLIPLRDERIANPSAEYDQAWRNLQHGELAKSQQEARHGYAQFQRNNPDWASKFQLLEAEAMLLRGMYDDALSLLADYHPRSTNTEDEIRKLSIEGVALTRQQQVSMADQRIASAESLCKGRHYATCGEVFIARGIFADEQRDFAAARQSFLDTLAFAQAHQDRYLEANAALNLGWTALHIEHFDEAMDWLESASQTCRAIGAEHLAAKASGNLGWAYLNLGDNERALELFLEAVKSTARRGDIHSELGWITSAGDVYRSTGDPARAAEAYGQALALANQLNSKEDIVSALEALAHASIDAGKLQDAESYLEQLSPLVPATANRLDVLDVMLAQGGLAAAQRDNQHAEKLLRAVELDPASQTSMRLGAEHELAALYESQGNATAADRMYRTALTSFESARDQLKNEESRLPFLANATSIYDDYVHFLVAHGKADEALRIADQSRAQTLAQGLGVASTNHFLDIPTLRPSNIAQKTDATLLFYWLGAKQSYLWAISSKKTELFPLPPQPEITQSIERYRKTLLGFTDPVENSNADGLALYRTLVAPASAMLQPGSNVVILCDGALSQLNFETLIVPDPHPHYWIEDATLVSAPSLHLLGSANSARPPGHKLLLFGDAVPPNADYPQLPLAASEMKQIEQHFGLQDATVYSGQRANAAAYLAVKPQGFAYIHFVAHGVASRTDPLDSAIILSRSTAAEDSFKLHAREIIQHPIHARLVTVSACYGSGARSYLGEGLVGLAWAFLRAGAHNVIGALWEVSDDSTSQLMGNLYQGLASGMPPSAALRQAKLSLLHSRREFRKPFYWAPFQIYTGL